MAAAGPTLPGVSGEGKTCEAVTSGSRPSVLQLHSVPRMGFSPTLRDLSLWASFAVCGDLHSTPEVSSKALGTPPLMMFDELPESLGSFSADELPIAQISP